MLNLFRRFKKEKNDPILEILEAQTKELSEINKSMKDDRERVERDITEAENILRELGYSEKDIKILQFKTRK